ncbi:MAG: MFS transporter [Acidimicrobiales bacterium]
MMPRGRVALFALACGVTVANLYYAQPLLPLISKDLGVPEGRTALVVTAAQVGYLLGLFFLVPLGDRLVRRRLVPWVMAADAVCLLAASIAPDFSVLMVATVLIGLCSTSAMILVPFAAHLADPERKGRVTGIIMSGLLLGILLARMLSGVLAQLTNWRTVYLVAAGAMVLLGLLLYLRLPNEEPRPVIRYHDLLISVAHYFGSEPLLRLRAAYGGLVFATFSVIWTSLAFLLAHDPYNYSAGIIGLFGLFGLAGALAATLSGHLADRGWERQVTGGCLALLVISVALMGLGAHHLAPLIIGLVLADLAIQSVHIQNQQLIFGIDPPGRSRINTGYMVTYFFGGAIGSATAGLAWEFAQWEGVITLGLFYAGAALLLWIATAIRTA